MTTDANDPFASTPPEGRPKRTRKTPEPSPGPTMPTAPPPAAPPEGTAPIYGKPKRFRAGIVVWTVVAGLVAQTLLIIGAAAVGQSWSGWLAALVGAIAPIVIGIVLVTRPTIPQKSVGLGLLILVPAALIVLPVVGFVACLVALSGSNY